MSCVCTSQLSYQFSAGGWGRCWRWTVVDAMVFQLNVVASKTAPGVVQAAKFRLVCLNWFGYFWVAQFEQAPRFSEPRIAKVLSHLLAQCFKNWFGCHEVWYQSGEFLEENQIAQSRKINHFHLLRMKSLCRFLTLHNNNVSLTPSPLLLRYNICLKNIWTAS